MNETLEQMMGWEAAQDNPHIRYYFTLAQHSDEWHRIRSGVITASTIKNLVSKKTKGGVTEYVVPDKDVAYLWELAAQRVFGELDEQYQSYDMMRGIRDEVDAFNLYSEKYEQLRTCGFVTNTEHGVLIGFSPDGLTALHDDGFIECKSRLQKFHAETIATDEMPEEYLLQVQTGLLVTKRKWCDYLQYCGGAPMFRKRIYPDAQIQRVIIQAAMTAESKIKSFADQIMRNILENGFHPTIKRAEDIQA